MPMKRVSLNLNDNRSNGLDMKNPGKKQKTLVRLQSRSTYQTSAMQLGLMASLCAYREGSWG